MAKANFQVLTILRNTISRIERSSSYQWGHMGLCNCGFLAQEITTLRKEEIHARAMQRQGDWNDQLNDYCPTSGLPLDEIITKMLTAGFENDDLKHLEKLSSPLVRSRLPHDERDLKHNIKPDVIKYLKAWASLIEFELISEISLYELSPAVGASISTER